MADSMNLTGFKELAAALKELGPRVAKKYLRRSVSKGTALVRKEVRDLAPVDTGEMRKDIQMKRERDQRGSADLVASYSVYVRTGKKSRLSGRSRNIEKNSWYWFLVEFGTSKMAARPFLRPGFEASKEDAVTEIGKTLDEGIQEEARILAGQR